MVASEEKHSVYHVMCASRKQRKNMWIRERWMDKRAAITACREAGAPVRKPVTRGRGERHGIERMRKNGLWKKAAYGGR